MPRTPRRGPSTLSRLASLTVEASEVERSVRPGVSLKAGGAPKPEAKLGGRAEAFHHRAWSSRSQGNWLPCPLRVNTILCEMAAGTTACCIPRRADLWQGPVHMPVGPHSLQPRSSVLEAEPAERVGRLQRSRSVSHAPRESPSEQVHGSAQRQPRVLPSDPTSSGPPRRRRAVDYQTWVGVLKGSLPMPRVKL
eukprot:scaffold33415_cov51-Phaeocystis_antarctica.AAC.2